MTIKPQNFAMFQGNYKVLVVTVKDLAGNIVPLNGATITWQLAKSNKGPPIINKTTGAGIVITDELGGVFKITLNPADTVALVGQHYHEAEIVDAAGNPATAIYGNGTFKRKLI